MKTLASSCLSLVLLVAAQAQDITPVAKSGINQVLPADVLAAVSSTSVKTIFPVTGTETFGGQVLRADDIVFQPGAKLVLTNLDVPWIAIACRRLKVTDPARAITIERIRSVRKAPDGSAGINGSPGADGQGEIDRQGQPGQTGGSGHIGNTGRTMNLPRVYLIADAVQSPNGTSLPGALRLNLNFIGIDGGTGGRGGNGGNGGNGSPGKEGASGVFGCLEGPGHGGNGGDGGREGRGGAGGNGGRGGDLVLVSNPEAIEQLSYANISNYGGQGGRGGQPGRSGSGGQQGGGGPPNGFCQGGSEGAHGSSPDPLPDADGPDGMEGAKGTVWAYSVTSYSPLF